MSGKRGFGSSILSGLGRAFARELLVQSGRKKAYRGGARISTWRQMSKSSKSKKKKRK